MTNQSANHPSFQFEPPQTESVAYAVNNLNQYTTVTKDGLPSPITHDQNGNLTNDGANTFGYDAENKLLTATMGVGTNVAYEYDPTGRRASKTVDGTVTAFVYDADHLIAEYDGSGNVLRRYIHGPGTDRPIAMVDASGARSYYHADRLGSVIALTDDAGAESARYTYDAYGVPFLVDPGTGALTQVAAGQPYLFTGRRFDFETGLYYYRARYYSASLGRFLQTDPIGYEDQMNLYAYAGNDPVNAVDPGGTCTGSRITDGGEEGYCANGGWTNDLKGSAQGEARRRAEAAITNEVGSTIGFPTDSKGSDGETTNEPRDEHRNESDSEPRTNVRFTPPNRYQVDRVTRIIARELLKIYGNIAALYYEQRRYGKDISREEYNGILQRGLRSLRRSSVKMGLGTLRNLYESNASRIHDDMEDNLSAKRILDNIYDRIYERVGNELANRDIIWEGRT